MFRVHNVNQWPNLRHLGESLGGAEGLLEAVSFKKAMEGMDRGRVANARWEWVPAAVLLYVTNTADQSDLTILVTCLTPFCIKQRCNALHRKLKQANEKLALCKKTHQTWKFREQVSLYLYKLSWLCATSLTLWSLTTIHTDTSSLHEELIDNFSSNLVNRKTNWLKKSLHLITTDEVKRFHQISPLEISL